MALNFGPPIMNFEPLGNLGKTFFDARDAAVKSREDNATRALLGEAAKTGDYTKAGQAMIAHGRVKEGVALLGLGQKVADRDHDAKLMNTIFGGGQSQPAMRSSAAIPTGNMGVDVADTEADTQRLERQMANYAPMAEREMQHGLPSGYLGRTAQIESGGNPNAKNPNSSAGGAFQFTDSTARQYGLTNKFDPEASADAAARLAADNKRQLTAALGREPTAGELYLAHQQGGGGASKLLANPNARAVDIVGADAVRLNGGSPDMSAGQFASLWVGKFGNAPRGQDAPHPVQMAQAGGTASDTPAQGASDAQGYVIPGTGQVIDRQTIANNPRIQAMVRAMGMAKSDKTRAAIKTRLDLELADLKSQQDQGGPLDRENKRLQNEKLRMEAQGGGKDREIAAREKALVDRGMDPKDPRLQTFVLTGRMPREDQQPLSASDKKAILEADEGVVTARGAINMLNEAKAVSAKALNGGPLAAQRGYGLSLFGNEAGSATVQLDNILTTQALSQLKTIFGGAPTEGERKILLDIQGASRLPHADRAKIIDRAIGMAERRLAMNERTAKEMRDQTYFKPGNTGGTSPQQGSPAKADGGWQDMGNGIRIREKR